MAIKEENEITVRVIVSDEDLINILKEKGFKESRKFTLDDYYLISKDIDITKLSSREILSRAIIIRYMVNCEKIIQTITFKIKNINEKNEIISQKAINCNILSIEEAKNLFKALGYYEIMNIKENDVIYYKDDFELAIKYIANSNTLIEIETNSKYNTIDKLKKKIEELELPIQKNEYFVKKAEEELNRILKQ